MVPKSDALSKDKALSVVYGEKNKRTASHTLLVGLYTKRFFSSYASDKRRLVYLISSWRQLGQVAPSWFKLILVGLFSPLVGQEFTEGFAIILVTGDPEQDILHPFTRVNVQCLATVHQGVDDGGTYCSIVVSTEQEVLPALCWQRSYVGIVR